MSILQAKVDNLGMYHAILDEYKRGTDLMHDIGMFIQRKPKKYTVWKLMSFATSEYTANK